jgi:pyrroloquinoline quinone biosynthesis protein B
LIIRVLGSAAGGGLPQWNCACSNCSAARGGAIPRRSQSSIALSHDEHTWYLVNVSPDIAQQIEDCEPLLPQTLRGTPIAGALFTDANVDHIGGLAVLRQQGDHAFTLRSSEIVRSLAVAQRAFAPFASPPHRWDAVAVDGRALSRTGQNDPFGDVFELRAIAVPGTTPGYAGREAIRGAVVAYAVTDLVTGFRALFAPVFAAIDDALATEIRQADVAFLDGSFFSDDELAVQGLGGKRARALGHQPVGGAGGTLETIRGFPNRTIFTHLNNSNPMLDPESAAAAEVAAADAEIAYDGMEITA